MRARLVARGGELNRGNQPSSRCLDSSTGDRLPGRVGLTPLHPSPVPLAIPAAAPWSLRPTPLT